MAIFRTTGPQRSVEVHEVEPGVRMLVAAQPGGVEGDSNKVAAASGEDKSAGVLAEPKFAVPSVAIFVVACFLATLLLGTPGGPQFSPAEGVGAFALFYIVAQSAERLTELVLPLLSWDGLNKEKKMKHLNTMVAAALSKSSADGSEAEAAADAQAEKDQTVANRKIVTFGISAAVAVLMCGYLEADFLSAVGVNFPPGNQLGQELSRLGVTGLVVGGGAAGLHSLITNLSKSSAKKDDPLETGGSA